MSSDIYCKIEGIPGESTDDGHKDWIDVEGFQYGCQQQVSGFGEGAGRTGGRVSYSEVNLSKSFDKSSPLLTQFCNNGKHITKIEFEFCLATEDKHVFLKYTLEDVIVSSVSVSGGPGGKPSESVSLSMGKISTEYTPIDGKGGKQAAVKDNWNLETNKKD